MTMLVWTGVVLLGGAGATLRFVLDGAITSWTSRSFPYGTLLVNLSGAVLLGLLTGLALNHDVALLAGSAAVGSYTTFSTWMFETERAAEDGDGRLAAVNVVASLVVGLAGAAAGRAIGRAL